MLSLYYNKLLVNSEFFEIKLLHTSYFHLEWDGMACERCLKILEPMCILRLEFSFILFKKVVIFFSKLQTQCNFEWLFIYAYRNDELWRFYRQYMIRNRLPFVQKWVGGLIGNLKHIIWQLFLTRKILRKPIELLVGLKLLKRFPTLIILLDLEKNYYCLQEILPTHK